jgi:hypothetical protein
MDGHRFDELTRGVAADIGRRGFIRAALGGALAAFAGTRLAAAQDDGGDNGGGNGDGGGNEKRRCPDGCPDGQQCIDGKCREAVCREDKECRDGSDACIGGRCRDGQCSQFAVRCEAGYLCCGNGECCPQPCATDIDCYVVDPCRVGRCVEGACSFETKDPCPICEADADCNGLEREAFCCNGVCTRPCPAGTTINKGCECVVDSLDDLNASAESQGDDASGGDGTGDAPADEPPAEGEAESADDGTITLGGPITITTSDAPESTITTAEPVAEEPADSSGDEAAGAGEGDGATESEAPAEG